MPQYNYNPFDHTPLGNMMQFIESNNHFMELHQSDQRDSTREHRVKKDIPCKVRYKDNFTSPVQAGGTPRPGAGCKKLSKKQRKAKTN